MLPFKAVKGFSDVFCPESAVFAHIEHTARSIFSLYGYEELRTPILENTELFSRSIGTATDVVQKEMYTFLDRKDRSVTLRPEATAGVMRAYIESKKYTQGAIAKFLSIGAMFRYERPQKGRLRQFHQINCECIGAEDGYADAELIIMLIHFLRAIQISSFVLQINALGCPECRPSYMKKFIMWIESLDKMLLCEDCQVRAVTNPMRILDCKIPTCKSITEGAPKMLEHHCAKCENHFSEMTKMLLEENISYEVNHRLVRGLDYYIRTTFEVVSKEIGAQGAIAGGGRYDGLVSQLGGPNVSGIGFACGLERLALLVPQREEVRPVFMVASLVEESKEVTFKITQQLRNAGFSGVMLFSKQSLKSVMRSADKLRVKRCLLIGSDELKVQGVTIKNMDTGEQEKVSFGNILSYIRNSVEAKNI